ncbi:MAG: ribonuclease III [Pseudomonadota bacterium]
MSVSTQGQLQRLQQRLGYQFQNVQLLQQALTHKSYAKENNERLEFVGDAVLGYLVGSLLYRMYSKVQEDSLSLMRAELVRGRTLAVLAKELELAPLLQLGSGELKSGGRQRDSILANAVEAVIGAVHEDGGIQACATLVDSLYKDRARSLDVRTLKDAKTQLQELLQAKGLDLPTYEVESISGADHERQYSVRCSVLTLSKSYVASASSRRGAEKRAAELMLTDLVREGWLVNAG